MQIILDLDGTICTEERTYSRSLAKPIEGAINAVQKLYDAGHTIIIYSARTWMEFEMTTDWLQKNKVPYHQLILGKPIGDVWIDDRALQFNNWEQIMKKLNNHGKENNN